MKIFIIHNGRQEYLQYCIKQLLKYNDAKDIIFLSDNKDLTKNFIKEKDICYENISDYFESAKKFEKIYNHMSFNTIKFELFCFQRWFIIRDYIKHHNINTFCHLDSDILLYCNVGKYYNKYLNGADFCYTGFSGHTFFGTKKGIDEFVNFINSQYTNNLEYLKLFSTGEKICNIKKNNGYVFNDETHSVTDMTLIDLFVKENKDNLKKIDLGIIKDNSVFDGSMILSEGFETSFGLKKIKRENNKPYGFLKDIKDKIFFNSLHFNCESKIFMKNFYMKKNSISTLPQFKFGIRKTFIQICENVFKLLGIYDFVRKIWIKILRFYKKIKLHNKL